MKIRYVNWNPNVSTVDLLLQAIDVVEDYSERGYVLTLRQLYYQLVARDIIPNKQEEYNRLGRIIAKARDAGYVDWEAIEDRTRQPERLSTWTSPRSIMDSAIQSYRRDKWEGQENRVFVWVEKEALAGVIEQACFDENIQAEFLSCRGYMSASTIWREGMKVADVLEEGQTPVILHLADHDPSGLDMTRDNLERLQLYAETPAFVFKRIALNMNQIEEHNPPPNPAKQTDSRFERYYDEYGDSAWELDALDPDVLVELVQGWVTRFRDDETWQEQVAREQEEKRILREKMDELEF